jgi:hypothetical protein
MASRRESIAESLLVAAGERRDRTVKASTQWRRLPGEVRDVAKTRLGAWYGGSYRGKDVSADRARRARRTFDRRAGLAASGTPVTEQPTSAAGVDRAWRGLDPQRREAAETVVAGLGPVVDLDDIPTIEDDLEHLEEEELEELEGLDELEGLEELPGVVSDAEAAAFFGEAGEEGEAPASTEDLPEWVFEGRLVVNGDPPDPGHWSGPVYETWQDAVHGSRGEDYVAYVARYGADGWCLWFPKKTPEWLP